MPASICLQFNSILVLPLVSRAGEYVSRYPWTTIPEHLPGYVGNPLWEDVKESIHGHDILRPIHSSRHYRHHSVPQHIS